MDIFKGIDFNDSFVLGWTANETEIIFQVEASIWPESPHYREPKSDEYTCYRKCEIKFTNFTSYSGLAVQKFTTPTIDLNGSSDYGNIDSLIKTNQGFKVIGEFGNLEIINGEVQVQFYT
ncbi:hypothetical protein MTF66_02600 [Pseudoalteromonas sp. 2CM39R]|uniref:hypothetical protein n=1 Tax=Pseudoalteromonas sp. 2CM39R TaxID=2929856 RepID=UPI0020C0571A|nr:hypothetical protein [Pseudoalteromonas sp. 2CM39R]MCK8123872.1 hypothetical protein [Pseudoalteromonas sp. 2CM39R]